MLLNMAVKINSHILLDFQILLYCKRDTMIKQYVFVVSLRFFFFSNDICNHYLSARSGIQFLIKPI